MKYFSVVAIMVLLVVTTTARDLTFFSGIEQVPV